MAVESIPITITGRIIGTSATQDSLMKGGDKRKYQKGVPNEKREIIMENGKPVREWYMRVAISKSAVDALGNQNNIAGLWDVIMKQASLFKPNGFQPDPSGASMSNPKDFSLKYKDGDTGKNEDGEPYSNYEFNKNALLLEISNRYAPKWLKRAEDGILEHCQEGEIKVGDHVAVSLLVGAGESSVYLNLISTLLLKSGERIGSDAGPKPEDAFAMFNKPTVGIAANVGNFGQQPQAQAQPSFAQQPAAQPSFAQQPQGQAQQPAAPHTGVLPPAFQPQAAPSFAQQPQANGPVQGGANPFQFPNNNQGTPRQ
jgi:hypothetical protein